MTDEGDLTDYLGVHIEKLPDGSFKLTQQQLIAKILKDLNFQEDTKPRKNPVSSKQATKGNETDPAHTAAWAYRSVIGKLNYLEKSSRPDISYAVHQAARFMEEPKLQHTTMVHDIGRYLIGTKDEGLIYQPTKAKFECFVDADFCGNWNEDDPSYNRDTARSRTGFVIKYAGCPIVWYSKLQTEIALSTTAAEYVALSQSMREVIPMMNLYREFKEHSLLPDTEPPTVYCTVFEDNEGAIELAKTPKMRPRTKYLNVKYHHFRDLVASGDILIKSIDTSLQQADIFTKGLVTDLFTKLRKLLLGW